MGDVLEIHWPKIGLSNTDIYMNSPKIGKGLNNQGNFKISFGL